MFDQLKIVKRKLHTPMLHDFLNALIRILEDMILTALTKSKEQQLTKGEIQSKGSFKIEANFHLTKFIIKVCEAFLLYTFILRHSKLICQK